MRQLHGRAVPGKVKKSFRPYIFPFPVPLSKFFTNYRLSNIFALDPDRIQYRQESNTHIGNHRFPKVGLAKSAQ